MTGDPYGYDPTAAPAPSPRTAGPTPQAPRPGIAPSPARYAYLVGRLRGRQITMEEATELFAIQQQILARTQAESAAPPPPPPPSSSGSGTAPPAPRRAAISAPGGLSDDMLWETLPVLAAAGIFAAIFKKAQSGDLPSTKGGGSPDPAPPNPPRRGASSGSNTSGR